MKKIELTDREKFVAVTVLALVMAHVPEDKQVEVTAAGLLKLEMLLNRERKGVDLELLIVQGMRAYNETLENLNALTDALGE
jgi:hypothetical protein